MCVEVVEYHDGEPWLWGNGKPERLWNCTYTTLSLLAKIKCRILYDSVLRGPQSRHHITQKKKKKKSGLGGVLAAYPWRPELRSPAPHVKARHGGCALVTPGMAGGERQIPEVHWLASLDKIVQCEILLQNNIKGKLLKTSHHQPLSRCLHGQTQANVHTYTHTNQEMCFYLTVHYWQKGNALKKV